MYKIIGNSEIKSGKGEGVNIDEEITYDYLLNSVKNIKNKKYKE